jgi:hypothetical protein
VLNRTYWAKFVILFVAIGCAIVSSAAAKSGGGTGHVSLSHVIDGDPAHVVEGQATVDAGARLLRHGPDGGHLVRFRGGGKVQCHPNLSVYVRVFARSRGPKAQIDQTGRAARLHAIRSGFGSAGPWRLDEIRDGSYGSVARHRRWLGVASFRIAHRRYAEIEVSGTADLTCDDTQFRKGTVVDAIAGLLSTARVRARIERAAQAPLR